VHWLVTTRQLKLIHFNRNTHLMHAILLWPLLSKQALRGTREASMDRYFIGSLDK
jgi:hypothetical protein